MLGHSDAIVEVYVVGRAKMTLILAGQGIFAVSNFFWSQPVFGQQPDPHLALQLCHRAESDLMHVNT